MSVNLVHTRALNRGCLVGMISGIRNVYHALQIIGQAAGVGKSAPGRAPASQPIAPAGPVRGQPGMPLPNSVEDYKILGIPTISRKTFFAALQHMSSPAVIDIEAKRISADLSDELFDICLAWGVNPAIALAFFQHESSGGTRGYATKTKNWGNLRSGHAQLRNDGNFAYYSAWSVGLDDWCRLLTGSLYVRDGLDTVSKVTPRYAPSADQNDPRQYAEAVNTQVAVWEAMG